MLTDNRFAAIEIPVNTNIFGIPYWPFYVHRVYFLFACKVILPYLLQIIKVFPSLFIYYKPQIPTYNLSFP